MVPLGRLDKEKNISGWEKKTERRMHASKRWRKTDKEILSKKMYGKMQRKNDKRK